MRSRHPRSKSIWSEPPPCSRRAAIPGSLEAITRGAVGRAEESTPTFIEMAAPGVTFEGAWSENHFFDNQEVRRVLRWREPVTRAAVFQAANQYAAKQLDAHARYAEWTGIAALPGQIAVLRERLANAEICWNVFAIDWMGRGVLREVRIARYHYS